MTPELRSLRRRVNRIRAKAFPKYTCAVDRHLHVMADVLACGKTYHMFTEEPEYCAESILYVLHALWTCRLELAKLKGKA